VLAGPGWQRLRHADFRADTNNLIVGDPSSDNIDVTTQLIINDVLGHRPARQHGDVAAR
jgi:hypothetical protein